MTKRGGLLARARGTAVALGLAGCADDGGVDIVTMAEGCSPIRVGDRLETRLVDSFQVLGGDWQYAEYSAEAVAFQALRDEAAVLAWFASLGEGYNPELPNGWDMPEFPMEMGVVVPFGEYSVVEEARTSGVIGFFEAGSRNRVVAVTEYPAKCSYLEYDPVWVALHAVPVGRLVECQFGMPEDCE